MTDKYYEQLWETILSGNVWHGKVANRRKSGSMYWAKQTVAPITNGAGQINRFVGILTDISPLKQREQQLEVLERVLRHNLRNEMTVIRGRAELIRWQVEAETATQVETILTKSDELIQLVEKERVIAEALSDDHQLIDIDVGTVV